MLTARFTNIAIHQRMLIAMVHKLVVVLLCAAISRGAAAGSGDVDTFSFPAFNATTMRDLIAATNSSILLGAYLLFERDQAFAATNRSEGFLLLPDRINVWTARDGAGAGGVPDREASFNSMFTLSGPSPVAFVILKDSYPTLRSATGLRGNGSVTFVPDGSASAAGLAGVEAGVVRSYAPDDPAVGLNVTVTPNGTAAASRTVWVEYDAAAHRLFVYVAAGGQARPARAALDAELNLHNGDRTTQTAMVGFFAGRISDIIDGVSGWELTVDALSNGSRNKKTSWAMMLVAVLFSVAATAAM